MSRGSAGTGLDLTDAPATRREWLNDIWRHRDVLIMMSRADFQARYKRAALGVIWAVVVPLLQGAVMVVIFSKVIKVGGGKGFAVYVLSGVIAWSYFGAVLGTGATAIVDGSGLTDKVWFPRALLVVVPTIANLVALVVSLAVVLVAMPVFSVPVGVRLLLLVPGLALLIVFSAALSMVLAALHVYFRDVRYLVGAALTVWFYVTPIVYPEALLGHGLTQLVDFNPVTGLVIIFQKATVGGGTPWIEPVTITITTTVALMVIALEAHRRHDRLFVDLL